MFWRMKCAGGMEMGRCLVGVPVVLILSIGVLPACDGKRMPASPGGTPHAVVFKDGCRLVFPQENPDQVWSWGVSPANACEYAWQVEITVDGDTYQLGYINFNPGWQSSGSGRLGDLLSAGQASLWQLKPGGTGASVVDGALMGSWVKGDALVCELHSQEWAERLFKDRPSSLKFITGGTLLQKTEREGSVVYKLDESLRGT
jgi:hypothetical protein